MPRFEEFADDGPLVPSPVDEPGTPAAAWHTALPGPELTAHLAAMMGAEEGLTRISDFDLVELVAAAQRIGSWAHYVAAAAAGELAEREAMTPVTREDFSGTLSSERITGEELAMRLGCSARSAQRLAHEGRDYTTHLYPTGEALREGRIDAAKARAIGTGLEDVMWQRALAVQEAVLPSAPSRTPRQLAADVRRALVELDPAEAVALRERAESTRYLSRPKPLPDGMVGLWLRTTALDAHALYESIDASARRARRAGDQRTLDQLRADLLVEHSLHSPECTGGDTGASSRTKRLAAPGSCSTAIRVDLRVLVPLSTLIGTDDAPAELEGYGLIDPEVARAWARGGTWRRLVTDPYSGTVLDVGRTRYTPPADLAEHVRFRDLECARPGCATSAWHSELDHLRAFGTNASVDGGPTAAHNLAPLSKGCHQIKTHAGFQVLRVRNGAYRWTTPTGHTYEHTTPAPARGPVRGGPGFRLKHELEENSPPRPAPTRPPSASSRKTPPGRGVEGTRAGGASDDGAPPPF